jgi:hypothetical protein
MSHQRTWEEYDQQQAGTPYWEHITNPQHAYRERLVQLLAQYPVDYPGEEFIMHPADAINLIDALEKLGIAVIGVSVWCFIPAGKTKEEHCPEGMGGPSRKVNGGVEWYSEYNHLGFLVSDFDRESRDINLAHRCNSQVRDYIEHELPKEPGYNEYLRVSPSLYIPLMWNLFS